MPIPTRTRPPMISMRLPNFLPNRLPEKPPMPEMIIVTTVMMAQERAMLICIKAKLMPTANASRLVAKERMIRECPRDGSLGTSSTLGLNPA